jgi:hypothetical protein
MKTPTIFEGMPRGLPITQNPPLKLYQKLIPVQPLLRHFNDAPSTFTKLPFI